MHVVFWLTLALPVQAAWQKDFLAAREAHQQGRLERFEQHARRLPADHALAPYIAYWRLRAGNDQQARLAFIERYADSPLAEQLRADIAREAARRGDWPLYQAWSAQLKRKDQELQCLDLTAALSQGESLTRAQLLALYRSGSDRPTGCERLFARAFEHGLLTPEDRYARLRLALEANNLRLARKLIAQLAPEEQPQGDALRLAESVPQRLISGPAEPRAQAEIALYALTQLARQDLDTAARLWEAEHTRYGEAERRYGFGQLALQAARRHDPRALEWFARAGGAHSEAQHAWRARAALRAGRWAELLQTIQAMPAELQQEAVWRYWRARAHKALGASFQANQLFAQLSREPHYYGLLAEEELPTRLEVRPTEYRVAEEEVRRVQDLPGIQRALLLRELNLMANAVAEWDWALREADDVTLLAAAELARRRQWYDRAIITAERTRELHDFDLRYLTPYRDLAQARAREFGLDEAWIYGLMRQESRFVSHARSRVGAQGLMQLMPATASWIARQLGVKERGLDINHPETNVRFGSYYLKRVLDDLQGSPVLATAAYNAGPGRARRWQAEVPLEGAVYVETIPFLETREYVKKVMANAMHYSHRLGLTRTALKERLGAVPARPAGRMEPPLQTPRRCPDVLARRR
ncbi:MAG: lytic transglycosylase domain-containing protein [Thiobacillaceae bacterium]|nr:lytic transglycosylase domain-containing protein [Thiobacillaceae bacterium]